MAYQITPLDAKGRDYSIVRESDGAKVPLDTDDPSFCEFLTWHNDQENKIPRFEFKGNSTFWCVETCETLISHLKRIGVMLFCEPNEDGEIAPVYQEHRTMGDTRMYQLCITTDYPVMAAPYFDVRYFGIYGQPARLWVSRTLLEHIRERMKSENDDIRCLAAWPVERAFVYVDISDFSRFEPGEQALVINTLGWLSRLPSDSASGYELKAAKDIESILCIGDGYIYCFKSSLHAAYFAARLANHIESHVARKVGIEFHFRMGVHVGDVFRFWDIGRDRWNYVGDGINGGNRILSAIGKDMDDVVFVSNKVRDQLLSLELSDEYPCNYLLSALQNRGRKSDKHGRMWRVYELHHTDINT